MSSLETANEHKHFLDVTFSFISEMQKYDCLHRILEHRIIAFSSLEIISSASSVKCYKIVGPCNHTRRKVPTALQKIKDMHSCSFYIYCANVYVQVYYSLYGIINMVFPYLKARLVYVFPVKANTYSKTDNSFS